MFDPTEQPNACQGPTGLQGIAMAACALLVLWLALLAGPDFAQNAAGVGSMESQVDVPTATAQPPLPSGATQDWWTRVTAELSEREYRVSEVDGRLQAPNRRHGLRTWFRDDGIEVAPRDERTASWRWRWRTTGWGREKLAALPTVEPMADVARVEYRHEGLVEWYENRSQGLEQGFTLSERPDGEGPLRIAGLFAGDLSPRADVAGVDFVDDHGTRVLRYDGLHAFDATGHELPSRLAASGSELSLEIDDTDAVYPVMVDPILTSPSWVYEGESDLARLGKSVATAGDVNGDGYSDVIVGSVEYLEGSDELGKAWLFFGSANGLLSEPAWETVGEHDGCCYGLSVACAGDVNGDGYDDVIVGSPTYRVGDEQNGQAYLYFGSPTGPSTDPDWADDGGEISVFFGNSVSTAGDVNSDGYDDILIGDPMIGSELIPRIILFYGSPTGPDHTEDWYANGPSGSALGASVSTAGDVNGDGFDDIIAGAALYSSPGFMYDGAIYLFLGSSEGLGALPDQIIASGYDRLHLGSAVSLAGDVDGDGYADVLAGCPFDGEYAPAPPSQVRLYAGSAEGLVENPAWTVICESEEDRFGKQVATAGDVNGDGYADILIGARGYDGDELNEGKAYLYLGYWDGPDTEPAWTCTGDQTDAYYGSVATAGDVNGDGLSDILVGACLYDGVHTDGGVAYCYQGGTDGPRLTPGWVIESNQDGGYFGLHVATAGDVNGDGYDDVLVGSKWFDNGQMDEGMVFLFLGTHLGLSWLPIWWAEGNSAGYRLASWVAPAGDVNGDGLADVVVGADCEYCDTEGEFEEGAAFAWYSAIGGIPYGNPDNADWSYFGGQEHAYLGWSVACAGDVNGDGYADVIVGAPLYDHAEEDDDEGAVFGFYGSASGLSTDYDWYHNGGRPDSNYGLRVASAGDMNGDGYSDVIIGAGRWGDAGEEASMAFVYLGSADGLDPGEAWWYAVVEEEITLPDCFVSVASAGDVNGDGYSDVITGAPYCDLNAEDGGAAFVWHGGPTPPPPGTPDNADWFSARAQADAYMGSCVASAGDVNGDGYSDVIISISGNDGDAGENSGMAVVYLGSADGLQIGAADWMVEGDQAGCHLSASVASAGDINGDGFSDVLVGAPWYSAGEDHEGRGYVFYGGGSRGLARSPRQWHSDLTTWLAPLGRSDSETSFGLSARGRTAAGRDSVRLEYEVEPFGTPFDGTDLVLGDWTDTGPPSGTAGSVVDLTELVSGLSAGHTYHWRLRVLGESPFFPSTPWLTLSWNCVTEMDLRTAGDIVGVDEPEVPRLAIALSNHPNPFNPRTMLRFHLTRRQHVRLQVYDCRGRLVRTLVDGVLQAGEQEAIWDGCDGAGHDLGSGMYLARLEAGTMRTSHKVTLLR